MPKVGCKQTWLYYPTSISSHMSHLISLSRFAPQFRIYMSNIIKPTQNSIPCPIPITLKVILACP
jgi:hypothetical protein